MTNINEQMKQAEKEYGMESEWFTFEEGENPIRVLTNGVVMAQHWDGKKYHVCYGRDTGCPMCAIDNKASVKWLHWIYDYKNKKLAIAKIPHTVEKLIGGYQANAEYAFEEFPMPYSLTVGVKDAGKTSVEYTLTPARSNTPVAQNLLDTLAKKTTVEIILDNMKKKQAKADGKLPAEVEQAPVEYPKEEINASEIPF